MAEQVWNERYGGDNYGYLLPPTQFPSKYNYLPEINTPRQGDTSLVPVLPRKNSPGLRTAYNDLDSDERLRQLEVRLNVSERSNRALLEEVLRLQGEVKTVTRRSDDILREEKAARHGLESAMKMNNELITQLSTRIKEAEEKIAEEKSALSSLVNHTKGVEHAVKSSQNELVAKKDVQSTRLIEMRGEIEDLLQAKGQLERITLQLSDDIRTLKMRIDQHNSDFSNVSQDLRTRSKKLEEDNRAQLDALRKTTSVQSHSEQQTTQLRSQVETRLTELRDVLVELRAKQESETADRRTSEQQTSQKFHDIQQLLGESNRKRDEGLHAVDMMLREKDHIIQADRLALTSKVADTVEDVNKKILSKEIKIREDIQERYIQLERLIQHEQQQRRDYEKTQREEVDRKFFTLKHAVEELSLELKEAMKGDKAKMKETVHKLDESISLLEKQTLENRKQFEKVMGAEISQRKVHERSTTEKLDGINEKLQIATSSLQQSIGGITQSMSTQLEKIRRESRSIITEQKDSTTRAMTDLDARVNFMKSRMNDFEEKLEARVATATQLLSENMREKVDNISMWQDTTQQTIKELSISVQKMPEEIYALQEKQTLMKSEVSSRLNAESDARMRDVEFIKQELQGLKTRRDPTPATKQDVENLNASVRKLADSIQTVKTVLGMKIQSEQKLRVSGLEDLQTQVNQIRVNTGIGTIYTTRPDYLHSDLDTGIGSWDDPTPSHARGSKDITSRADADPYNKGPGAESNANMATIKEGTETNRTNRTKTPITPTGDKGKSSPPRNETPSWSRTATPAGKKNATPLASRNATPAQSRNATPAQSRNATPSQSRNATPTQNGNRQNDG